MNNEPVYRIFPLGDSAITIDFGNVINESVNEKVLTLFHRLQQNPLPGMIEAIPAYSSLSIFYNVYNLREKIPSNKTVFEEMCKEVEKFMQQNIEINEESATIFRNPGLL